MAYVPPFPARTIPPLDLGTAVPPPLTAAEPEQRPERAQARVVSRARIRVTTFTWAVSRVVVTTATTAAAAPHRKQPSTTARPHPSGVPPFPPPTTPPRAPFLFGSGAAESTHSGSGGTPALADMAAGFPVFVFFLAALFLLPRARGALAPARPHPPG